MFYVDSESFETLTDNFRTNNDDYLGHFKNSDLLIDWTND